MIYPYDPQAGMDLLESLGWTIPEGETYRTDGAGEWLAVVLSTTNNKQARYAWGELFEQQMLECGIQVPRFHAEPDWLFHFGLPHRNFELGAFTWIWGEEDGFYDFFGCDQVPSQANGWTGINYVSKRDISTQNRIHFDFQLTQMAGLCQSALVLEQKRAYPTWHGTWQFGRMFR
jgi:ABC-type transport system substrate-binding protein